jgi:hypothetical protein
MSIRRDGDLLVDEHDAQTFAPVGDGERRGQLRAAAEHLVAAVAYLDGEVAAADTDEARQDAIAKDVAGVEGLTEAQVKAVLKAASAAADKPKPKGE